MQNTDTKLLIGTYNYELKVIETFEDIPIFYVTREKNIKRGSAALSWRETHGRLDIDRVPPNVPRDIANVVTRLGVRARVTRGDV